MNYRKTDFGFIERFSTNFIVFTYDENIEVGVKEMVEVLAMLRDYVSINGKIKLIIEIPPTTVMSSEAMAHLEVAKYKNENTIAVAIVTKSIAQRLGSKFYHTKVEVGVPTKFFKAKEEAVEWISQV